MRTPEERDRQILLIVQTLVRFLGVLAGALCVLAAISLVVDIPAGVGPGLLVLALLLGAVAAAAHLLRVGRGGRASH